MARPKQPIALVKAKGKKHLTKAETEERQKQELKANADKCLIPPKFLNKELKIKYKKIAQELKDLEIMSNLDVNGLGFYLINEQKYEEISTKILDVEVGSEEFDMLLRQQERLFKILRASASDMGLTISSRCKLVVPKVEEKPTNAFMELMS